MAKRTAGEANMSDIVGPQHVTKRRKITLLQKQNQNVSVFPLHFTCKIRQYLYMTTCTTPHQSGHRQWRPMEICCILELVVHPDAEKVYADNPNLDASLLEAQDWNSISRWMTGYFSTAQPFWFSSNSLPKTPYTATECKQLAMNTLCRHHKSIEMNGINQMNAMNKMNGKLPSRFSELSILCNAVRQIYLDHALKILDSRRTAICGQMNQIKTLQNLTPPKSPKLIQLTPSVSAPSTPNGKNPKSPSIRVRAHKSGKPMKSDEEQCRTHLSMVLVKLSEYNQNTRRTMRQKLDQRYKEKFKTILDETSPGPKSAVCSYLEYLEYVQFDCYSFFEFSIFVFFRNILFFSYFFYF